jgi:hypothetical protein
MRMRLVCLLIFLGLGGCATQEVRCDGRLEPINPPQGAQPTTAPRRADHGTRTP